MHACYKLSSQMIYIGIFIYIHEYSQAGPRSSSVGKQAPAVDEFMLKNQSLLSVSQENPRPHFIPVLEPCLSSLFLLLSVSALTLSITVALRKNFWPRKGLRHQWTSCLVAESRFLVQWGTVLRLFSWRYLFFTYILVRSFTNTLLTFFYHGCL